MKNKKYNLEEYKTICACHKEILRLSSSLYRDNFDEMKNNLQLIHLLSDRAYEMGLKLEDRLKKYRKNIEKLGFKRVKNV